LFHLSNKIGDFKPQDIVEKLHFEKELKNTPFAKKNFRPNPTSRNFCEKPPF
jgi:hypothetical protein